MTLSPSPPPPEQTDLTYTSGMRIFGGIAWGTLVSVLVAIALILPPQVPRSWLWAIPPLWVALSLLGIALQWSVARGSCPKCGFELTVPILGKRCPKCRSYLKAVNRQIVKL
ncbi:hypothetical protein GS597_10125 [Synechococcales cyanobacterium C]|uniref:Uncharacterized protein n=1 Tax=Petrachloros mirabilis ULC683 TaxID=2781853 RepID=A0A8K1ZXS7_9CYAN|nr:hypothetical protein [Petrachloros mirabilis]NCJ06858.1 hypothetical protein [Petrachloros mirabilis ULC683]